MDRILCVETGTHVCSVALAQGSRVEAVRESADGQHAQHLTPLILQLLADAGIGVEALAAVAVGMGPGSYTGLRIGVSVAKGICYGASIPLIAIGSLEAMAYGARERVVQEPLPMAPQLFCPMIDARRMEVYTALFDAQMNPASPVEAMILQEHSFGDRLREHRILFFGNGAFKAKALIGHRNALYLEGFTPSAAHMAALAHRAYLGSSFVDTAYFEPFYLKDFVATRPRNRVLGPKESPS